MKIGKYDITLGNIKAYVQGNLRYYAEKYGPAFAKLDEHLREQIAFRELVANPECKEKEECKCHCPIPELFYADKTCEDSCYPVMMTRDEWTKFKNSGVDIKSVAYPFDWTSVVVNLVNKVKREAIAVEDATFDCGDVKKGEKCYHTFTLINPHSETWMPEHITTSCYCTVAGIQVDADNANVVRLPCEVDTIDKTQGQKETVVLFNYTVNEGELKSKLISLVIKLNVI